MKLDVREKYNVWNSTDGGRETISIYALTKDILSTNDTIESIVMTLDQVLYLDQMVNSMSFLTPLPVVFRGIPIEILPKDPVVLDTPIS